MPDTTGDKSARTWRQILLGTLLVLALVGAGYVAGFMSGQRTAPSQDPRSLGELLSDFEEAEDYADEVTEELVVSPEFRDPLDRLPMKETETEETVVPVP